MEIEPLIERCRHGEEDALSELYKAYAPKLRSVCRRYISNEDMVNDALHDAFVVIFTSFDTLRDDSKAEAWMVSIARNVALKCNDYAEILPTISIEEINDLELPPSEEGETDVRGLSLSEVIKLIDQLPEGYKQVFRLSVFEDLRRNTAAFCLYHYRSKKEHQKDTTFAHNSRYLDSLNEKIFHAAKLLLFGHVHKYPKLAFFSSTYCGNPQHTSTEKEHPAYHAGQLTKGEKRANGDSAHRTSRR